MRFAGAFFPRFVGKFPDALEVFFVGIGGAGGEEEGEDREGEEEERREGAGRFHEVVDDERVKLQFIYSGGGQIVQSYCAGYNLKKRPFGFWCFR